MKNSAALSIAGAGTLWGLIGLFVNILAAKGFAPLQIATLRVTTAMLLTALIIWRTCWRRAEQPLKGRRKTTNFGQTKKPTTQFTQFIVN